MKIKVGLIVNILILFLLISCLKICKGQIKIKNLENKILILESSKDFWFDNYINESFEKKKLEQNLDSCEYIKNELENFIERDKCYCLCSSYKEPSFITIIEEVSKNYEYEKDVFDCSQFTSISINLLEKEGWEVEHKIGKYNNQLHEWGCIKEVCYEATKGIIIEPVIYDKYYRG